MTNPALARPVEQSRMIFHRQVLKDGNVKIVRKEYDAQRKLRRRDSLILAR